MGDEMSTATARALFCLAMVACALAGPALAGNGKKNARYLYTAANPAGPNFIHGYAIEEDGSLRELPSSPTPTGGLGIGLPTSSDNGLAKDETGRFLYAVNPRSNDVSVFRIGLDGALTAVEGSPFPTGGFLPFSIQVGPRHVFVSHIGNVRAAVTRCVGCDVRSFRRRPGGAIELIEDAVVSLDGDLPLRPQAIKIDPSKRILVVPLFSVFPPIPDGAAELLSFQINHVTGRLTPAPGSPHVVRRGSNQPIGLEFNPRNRSQLFVANSVQGLTPGVAPIGEPIEGNVSTYLMASTGQLTELDGSPAPAGGENFPPATDTCWVDLTSDGRHLYATNTTAQNMSFYDVAEDGTLTLRDVIFVPTTIPKGFAADVRVAHDEFLYVLDAGGASIAGWSIGGDGSLTPLAGLVTLPSNARPYGLVLVEKRHRP